MFITIISSRILCKTLISEVHSAYQVRLSEVMVFKKGGSTKYES